MKKLVAIAALTLAALPAQAVEYPYLGLDVLQASYQSSVMNGDLAPTAVRARFGSSFTGYLGGEAHVVIGAGGDGASIIGAPAPGATWDVNLSGAYSVNLVAHTGTGKLASAYAFVGYGVVRLSRECSGTVCAAPGFAGANVDEDGPTYGAGVEARVWNGWRVEVDFASYLDNDANTLTAVGVGIRHNL